MTREGQSLPTAGLREWDWLEVGRELTKDPFTGKTTCLHLWVRAGQSLLAADVELLLHQRRSSPV